MALSAEDRALALAVTRWAYANGWKPKPRASFDGWEVSSEWTRPDVLEYVTVVRFLVSGGGLLQTHAGELSVTTVAQAVDVLVALEMLPSEFSSAYRAGRKAASKAVAEMPAYLGDEGWGRMADLAEAAGYPRRLVTDRRKRDDYTTVTIESAYQYGYRRAAEVAR